MGNKAICQNHRGCKDCADGQALENIRAALVDPSLNERAKLVVIHSYVHGLEEPTADDIAWAKGELKRG